MMMGHFAKDSVEGRLNSAAPPQSNIGGHFNSRRWLLAGVGVSLMLWTMAMGDPRISYDMTPVDGQGPPILIARGPFGMMAETDMSPLAISPRLNSAPSTYAQAEAIRPIFWGMATPGVAEALGLDDEVMRNSIPSPAFLGVVPGTAIAKPTVTGEVMPSRVPSDSSASPAPASSSAEADESATTPSQPSSSSEAETMFSYPENLAPGGSPSASLAQILNPTDQPVLAELRPVILDADAGLCGELRIAAVLISGAIAPELLAGGPLMDVLEQRIDNIFIKPGQQYDLAIFVAVPDDLSNEHQNANCTVNFLMHFQGVT